MYRQGRHPVREGHEHGLRDLVFVRELVGGSFDVGRVRGGRHRRRHLRRRASHSRGESSRRHSARGDPPPFGQDRGSFPPAGFAGAFPPFLTTGAFLKRGTFLDVVGIPVEGMSPAAAFTIPGRCRRSAPPGRLPLRLRPRGRLLVPARQPRHRLEGSVRPVSRRRPVESPSGDDRGLLQVSPAGRRSREGREVRRRRTVRRPPAGELRRGRVLPRAPRGRRRPVRSLPCRKRSGGGAGVPFP